MGPVWAKRNGCGLVLMAMCGPPNRHRLFAKSATQISQIAWAAALQHKDSAEQEAGIMAHPKVTTGTKKLFTKSNTLQQQTVEATHSGQVATVERPCEPSSGDVAFGPMFVIRFDDGLHGVAFAAELTDLLPIPEKSAKVVADTGARISFQPDWTAHWTKTQAEKELHDFTFRGPGWYHTTAGDTLLVIPTERDFEPDKAIWNAPTNDNELFQFCVYNNRNPFASFNTIVNAAPILQTP